MSEDTISRKAAIEAINIHLNKTDVPASYPGIITALEEWLNNLPSAQPEIVQCKDCKYGAPNGKYGCRVYHYKRYETHDMKPDDFCSFAERKTNE